MSGGVKSCIVIKNKQLKLIILNAMYTLLVLQNWHKKGI